MRLSKTKCSLGALLCFLAALPLLAQSPSPRPGAPQGRYQNVLNRLESMTTLVLDQWRSHEADIPHTDYPSFYHSNWTQLTLEIQSSITPISPSHPGRS